MKELVSKKNVISAVFVILAIAGTFFVTSPVDNKPLFEVMQLWLVVATALGITITAKVVQNIRYNGNVHGPIPNQIGFFRKLWELIDPTKGVIMAIGSFTLATVLVYYRLVDFNTWFGYHALFIAYFSTVNVAQK